MTIRALIFLFFALAFTTPAHAHKPSDSYLRLHADQNQITGEWAIALRDLDMEAGIDSNFDGKITWGELLAARESIEAKLAGALSFESGKKPCPIHFTDLLVDQYSDGHYAVLHLGATCADPIDTLVVSYQFLFDLDAQHKGLLSLTSGEYAQSAIFSTDLRKISLSTHAPGLWQQFREYTRQGMWHIWLGFDHFLFLIALLLPSAWVYRNGIRRTDMPFGTVFREVFVYVSAFTIAHAITLALALFDLIHVQSRLVESLIALTIIISCINNLWPFLKQRLWLLTFGFGLIHGMGFATTLSELGLTHTARWIALFGFNFGVELGQLAVVAILLPIFYTIREHKAYGILVVRGLSLVILGVASIWFVQRAFGIIIFRFLRY